MTDQQITSRCENCGGLKKEHGVRKPYKCPTRLKDTAWTPWTVESYAAALEAAQEAAPVTAATMAQEAAAPQEFDLTPNFARMFHGFVREAGLTGATLTSGIKAATGHAAILRAVQVYLAPVTVAINCATSVAEIEQVRTVMADVLARVDKAASEAEAEAEDQEAAAQEVTEADVHNLIARAVQGTAGVTVSQDGTPDDPSLLLEFASGQAFFIHTQEDE